MGPNAQTIKRERREGGMFFREIAKYTRVVLSKKGGVALPNLTRRFDCELARL
jgi:hypothetical protein